MEDSASKSFLGEESPNLFLKTKYNQGNLQTFGNHVHLFFVKCFFLSVCLFFVGFVAVFDGL